LLEQDAPEMVAAARATGEWAARLHGSAVAMPRSCGPPKQQRALERWSAQTPELGPIAERVSRALLSARDPEMPVHYDHYHQQVLVGAEDVTVVDLDEAGRGDPAFDVAHFRAHLELLAFQHRGDGAAYDAARDLYRAGYESVGPWPADDPLLSAFAWCKLANQLLARNAPVAERRYAISALEALAGML
jgi:Ser/Thr protein kinase RdoA (MazF antagonist)